MVIHRRGSGRRKNLESNLDPIPSLQSHDSKLSIDTVRKCIPA